MAGEARKKAHNGCAVLTEEEGFEIVCNYYGINHYPDGRIIVNTTPPVPAAKPTPQLDINLDDLL